MYNQFGTVIVFTFLGAAFVFGSLIFGYFIRLRRAGGQKHEVYECGEPTIGDSWIRYNSRFYNVALVYLLFDVEVVLLIPAVMVLKDLKHERLAVAPLLALLAFLGLLILGLAYEWFYGNLDWINTDSPKKVDADRA
jgi:NADH-quinone oxidoreductase subunit A